MSDLISRKEAITAIERAVRKLQAMDYSHSADKAIYGLIKAMIIVELTPSAEPKTGKWVRNFNGNEWYWFCSNCKEEWYEEELWMGGNNFPNFCPNCGSYNGGKREQEKGEDE